MLMMMDAQLWVNQLDRPTVMGELDTRSSLDEFYT